MAIFTRKPMKPSAKSKDTLELHTNVARTSFLELPGEIRNLIYTYAAYPSLPTLHITHGSQRHHFSKAILNLNVLRICRQMRAEALSEMCARKPFHIVGVDVASAFFDCIGKDAVSKIKELIIAQPVVAGKPIPTEHVELFFRFLEEATGLRRFKIEIGRVGEPFTVDPVGLGQDWDFLVRLRQWAQEKDVKFTWASGMMDSRSVVMGTRWDESIELGGC